MRTTLITLASGVVFSSFSQGSPLSLNHRATTIVPGFEYVGCQTEPQNTRALSESTYFDDRMTVGKCAVACSAFTYFGVEYGRECFCGNTLHAGSLATGEGDCNFPCGGNSAETCGAGNRLNLYKKSTGTTVVPTAGTYIEKGCYTEATVGRALASHVFYDFAMTIQKCATACADYTYFGVEYHHECFCGNTIEAGSVPAPTAECKYKCDGDTTQFCGGDWRLNMYTFAAPATPAPAAPVYASQGCYTDSVGNRALTGSAFFDDAMTVDKCSLVCSGWEIFGVEYGRECYCGSELKGGSVVTPPEDCSFPCPGNPLQKCGAGDRLNIFRYGSASSSSSSSTSTTTTTTSSTTTTTSSTTTTTTTTTTSTSPTPTPTVNALVNGDFERIENVLWTPSDGGAICATCTTWDFKSGGDLTTGVSPHGGLQMAVIEMKLSGSKSGNFETTINTLPNQSYSFSAWSWMPLNAGQCQIRYYFQPLPGSGDGSFQSVDVSTVVANLGIWKETTATFSSGSGGVMQVIVQIQCFSALSAARKFYVDDVSLALL